MSDRLAFSASLSVLMMSIYVLFGGDAVSAPFGPQDSPRPHTASSTGFPGNAAQLLISFR